MHMISRKDLSNALPKSCSPTIVITANGEVQTQEEAIVYVNESDIFFTMKVLENTPAVLSLGKLCDENGVLPRMDQWSKTISHQRRDSDNLQYGKLRSYRGSRLIKFFFSSSSTLRTSMKQESHSSSSSSSSPSSPTVGEITVRERGKMRLTVTFL